MPVEVQCVGCQARLRVADEFVGRQVKCPQCKTQFWLPNAPMSPAKAALQPIQSPMAAPANMASMGAIQAAAGERWYLQTEQGQQYGPIPRAELDKWVIEGRVSSGARVLRQGDTAWRAAVELYPVLRNSQAPAAPYSAAGPSQPGYALGGGANPFADNFTNAYQAPQTMSDGMAFSPRRYVKPHRGGAVLIVAILGWTACFVCGIAAWVMGHSDLEDMRRGRMDRAGEGITRVGMILGMVQTILVGLGIVFIFLMLALGGMK